MITKDEFAALLERRNRTNGFRNAGHWFGLTYRRLRFSMLLNPEHRDILRERRQVLLAAWKEFVSQHLSSKPEPTFPHLEQKLAEYVADLQAKGISCEILKDEVLPPACGVAVRKVLVADCRCMKVFVQLWLDSRGPLKDVAVNEIHADDAIAFAEYLDKKRAPQQAEGEFGR
ncbi:hypothetical protein G3578_07610 [Brevibacillus sp. SYP-B805]|uniref:hypothetical protein n=1 Tax=Brevibacillus sp. SYP-B805 TaxID=1578199 RepID=UPI0013EC7123|nr:hypothetical protein [Brevibacillus sp. SYP-B805]NGQ95050.1 hypothetical protein [Brevibacillus sp. SYP-B805]